MSSVLGDTLSIMSLIIEIILPFNILTLFILYVISCHHITNHHPHIFKRFECFLVTFTDESGLKLPKRLILL